jgi:undecaprenyl-diphosphatase
MHEFEKKIVMLFNQHRSRALDLVSGFVSSVLFLVVAWVAIAGFILYNDLLVGIFVCLGLAVVFILHFIISEGLIKWGGKLLSWERLRPYQAYPKEIRPIGKNFLDSSFPSSHVASMAGALVVLVYFYGFLWPVAIVAIAVMGWSRLRNGMHYPSDILAGLVLGLLYGYLTLAFLNNISRI